MCARLSCILSFRVNVKLIYHIVSYRTDRQTDHTTVTCVKIGEIDYQRCHLKFLWYVSLSYASESLAACGATEIIMFLILID